MSTVSTGSIDRDKGVVLIEQCPRFRAYWRPYWRFRSTAITSHDAVLIPLSSPQERTAESQPGTVWGSAVASCVDLAIAVIS